MQKNDPRPFRRGLLAALAALALSFGAGCFFDGGASREGGTWDDFPNPQANMCGDITPGQMQRGDSLVALARPKLDGELDFFLGDSAERWSAVRRRDLGTVKAQYAAAVEAAPNHCGALFGQAVTTALGVVQDRLLDTLVREAEGSGDFGGLGGLAKASADGGARNLVLLKRGMAGVDKSLLTLFQETGEKALLPRLDSTLENLERIRNNDRFGFEVGVDGRSTRLDRSELEPLLAGLKTLKAALYVMIGYQWRVEEEESYPRFKVLREMDGEDFDSLRAEQREALDHYTDLLRSGNRVSRIRPGWEERVAAVPSLLLAAVEHVQEGLRHGIRQAEAREDQGRDPYIVGTGENADVDPADLRRAVDYLERAKKYLRGEVPIAFSEGRDTLRVDFPKLFRVNGLQAFLPHFRFHPYEMWNDTVVTEFGDEILGPIQFTDAEGETTLEGYELLEVDDVASLAGRVIFPDPTFGGVLPGMTNAAFWPTVDALLGEGARSRKACVTRTDGVFDWEECEDRLPLSPSDLDLLDYYLRALGL